MKQEYLIAIIILISVVVGCVAPFPRADNKKVLDAINSYIQKKFEEHGGVYTIKGVKIKSYHIHNKVRERDGLLVSCVDFKTVINIYDVDFYIRIKDGEYIVVKELFHKRNGVVVNEILWQQN